jgi:DNA-binding GntR family transcriptional regulator
MAAMSSAGMPTGGRSGESGRAARTAWWSGKVRAASSSLRRRIKAGEWNHGEQLPAVGQLSEHYGAARRTITKSLRVLADEGLLTVLPNWGTFRAEK